MEEWLARLVDVPVTRTDDLEQVSAIAVGGPEAVKDVGPLDLDLVGILVADLAARRPGLAAAERALAVWMEAAGWARPNGRVVVQTNRPGDPDIQALVQGNPMRHYRAELQRRAAAGFPVGYPVFRVTGRPGLRAALDGTAPHHVLATTLGEQTVCLVTVRPEGLGVFGRVVRELVDSGIVSRVEAEPHL